MSRPKMAMIVSRLIFSFTGFLLLSCLETTGATASGDRFVNRTVVIDEVLLRIRIWIWSLRAECQVDLLADGELVIVDMSSLELLSD